MKKGMMFYKIFVPLLVLGVGLVIGFGSYVYWSTTNAVINRIANSKQAYITQIKNNLEQKIQIIEYAFNTYSTTSSFRETIENPMSVKDFIAYRNVNTQLNYIASMGLEGAEYALISLDQNWKISNGSLSYLTSTDREKLYQAYINNQEQSLFWVKTDTGIRFVNTLPVFSKKKQAIALSDISFKSLDRSIKTDKNTTVLMFNKRGELMYETGFPAELLSEQKLREKAASLKGLKMTGMTYLEGRDQQTIRVMYAKSNYNGWTYMTILDQKEVADALKMTKFGLIAMGLIVILFVVLVAYLTSLYFTKPIQMIKGSLPKGMQTTAKNEIEWILSTIDSIVTEKESLQNLIEAERPQLETQLILNLFRNRVSPEEVSRKLPRLGYHEMEHMQYQVMLIQLDHIGDREGSDKDVLLLAVNKIIEEAIPVEQRMLPVILNDSTQATILMFRETNEEEIRKLALDYASRLITAVRDYLKVSISVGISKVYHNLLESKGACEMSKQALHQRLHLGKESIIFYEDISMLVSGPVMLHYPVELENRLFDAIRLGEEEQARHTLQPLLAEMMIKNKNPLNFEVMLIRFVNNLIQLEQLLGIEVLLTPDNHALYHRVLDIRNPEEVERMLLEEVINPMVEKMKEKTHTQFRCLSEKIAAMVRSDYDKELSLGSIAERLHYNPNYLSSIFKKEFGVTFSEYLVSYRLDIAKKWLVETDMTIKEIAERLQYHNSQNFIRSFRKREQLTPGAYRKMKMGS